MHAINTKKIKNMRMLKSFNNSADCESIGKRMKTKCANYYDPNIAIYSISCIEIVNEKVLICN